MENLPKIYLASKSPRRRRLLSFLNIDFDSFSVDTEEAIIEGEDPTDTVIRLSKEKMEAASKVKQEGILITADTIVVLDGKTIGKPANKEDAFRILNKLSGKTHTVYTGFSLVNKNNGKELHEFVKTDVTFRKLEEKEMLEYIDGGSPMDKAGAYGIQDDFGAVFVGKISGCYYNVVGLPLSRLYSSLKQIV